MDKAQTHFRGLFLPVAGDLLNGGLVLVLHLVVCSVAVDIGTLAERIGVASGDAPALAFDLVDIE